VCRKDSSNRQGFQTVPIKDYPAIFPGGEPSASKTVGYTIAFAMKEPNSPSAITKDHVFRAGMATPKTTIARLSEVGSPPVDTIDNIKPILTMPA
jgi:hypothetical protein